MNPKFEFYVLNHDFNRNKVKNYNIFNNIVVYEATLKAVKKYCRAPSKFKYEEFMSGMIHYGFSGFCKELQVILREEWSRCEYEIFVGNIFIGSCLDREKDKDKLLKALKEDVKKLEKWDCYQQAIPNIEIIAREVIYQYKKWDKQRKSNKKENLNEEKNIKTN